MDIQAVGANNFYQPPQKSSSQETSSREITTASTDKVDAEIERLKTRQAQLTQKLSSSQNPDLQRQLAQIEDELRQKDNDTYRRQHAEFSTGVDITI